MFSLKFEKNSMCIYKVMHHGTLCAMISSIPVYFHLNLRYEVVLEIIFHGILKLDLLLSLIDV